MPEKKNQHYLSQFYLRNFSYDKTNLCVYIESSDKAISGASSKDQASKSYLYWKGSPLEDFFWDMEWILNNIIWDILIKRNLINKFSFEHYIFLAFLLSLKLRNPFKREQDINTDNKMHEHLEDFSKKYWWTSNDFTTVDKQWKQYYTEAIKSYLFQSIPYLSDLDYIILRNDTEKDIFTSDYPVVFYNKLMLSSSANIIGKIWYTQEWLIITLPLSDKFSIMFYDWKVYDILNNKQKVYKINNEDVNDLNLLQYWNSNKCIYYKNYRQTDYIKEIINKWREHKLWDRNKMQHILWWHITLENEEIIESYKPRLTFLKISKYWKQRLKKINTTNLIIWAHLGRVWHIQAEMYHIDNPKNISIESKEKALNMVFENWWHFYNYASKMWSFIEKHFHKL